MGLTQRLERRVQPKELGELEAEIQLFEAKRGRIDRKRGHYWGDNSSPEDQQPFMSHVLFAFRKRQDTSIQARMRGEEYHYVPQHTIGHLYHSFPNFDEAEEVRPQPYRLKIPEFRLRGLKDLFVTRVDLLNQSHIGEANSIEGLCTRAIALGVQRHLEGIPGTVADPSIYLIEK